jgi:hypothetical protein
MNFSGRAQNPHAGRFQAQGKGGMLESEPWNEKNSLRAVEGHRKLGALKYKLSKNEYLLLAGAFQKAHGFVEDARPHGVGPTKQSWPQPPRRDQRRVDIEVQSGIAFVD